MSQGAQKKMEKPRKFQAIRGTRDLLPPDTALWNHVEQTAREVFATFGFGEIRPPIIEDTNLFARSIGGETDVVSKEMYTFPDRLEDHPETAKAIQDLMNEQPPAVGLAIGTSAALYPFISLRPEATASVCRAYIEHNMQQWLQPVKLYYIGPMFRRERPQKGRYRQFYQIGAEILEAVRPESSKQGASASSSLATRRSPVATSKEALKDAAVDAELIEMLLTFFERLGLHNVQLQINSIGDKNCRPKYVELLREELRKVKDKLGPDSQRRIETNPLRVLDSKLESEQEIIEKLPRITQHLCDACRENYDEVKRQLAMRGTTYTQNFRLVRGLDYYMRTTFEITARGLGSQDAVCGGGRYDGLVELLGGPPTKGIGFAIGEDRLILSLQEGGKGAAPQGRDVYIAWMGERAYASAIRAAKTLRHAGLSVELPPNELKFGKALERASKLNARFALILGDDEVASGQWTLKTLADGSQQKLTEQALLEYLRR